MRGTRNSKGYHQNFNERNGYTVTKLKRDLEHRLLLEEFKLPMRRILCRIFIINPYPRWAKDFSLPRMIEFEFISASEYVSSLHEDEKKKFILYLI
ncbi:hypothetical protein CDAR_105581 [Caerostris darwini]|uniref:Uncharacterized protein n=1 Tax=Caerostris darwini TaxID=1538125 RepID=A0AAV4MZ52_9ARAC|nr:hypothetical protein CDAR_105581 [Caerostris darwini]